MDTSALELAHERWIRVVMEIERIRNQAGAVGEADWESTAGAAYRARLQHELAGLDRLEQLGRDLLGAYRVHIGTVGAIRLPGPG